jgi:aconitate hydratase
MAESPVRMFKYLLLKTIYTVSDVDVVERSQYDMSFKYFLDMNPEDDVINFLDLTEFAPGKPLTLELIQSDGTKDIILANHTYNESQIGWFVAGSALNLIAAGKV